MTPVPMDAVVAAWKRQFDVAFELAEAIVEGVEKAREIQLAAAADTRAWLEAARKSFAAASPDEYAALPTRLANENFGKIAEYWSRLAANARDTQARIVGVVARGAGPTPLLSDKAPLSEAIDAGYKQWLDTLRKLYPTFSPVQSS
ncbi:MAG TPA: phasin family protein [Burkholderiales bacterium]|nr:phasin family protein [Burkholderiales bacterium]